MGAFFLAGRWSGGVVECEALKMDRINRMAEFQDYCRGGTECGEVDERSVPGGGRSESMVEEWRAGVLGEGGERVGWLGAVGRRNLGTRTTRPYQRWGWGGADG
jgi:hypothetical protein